jgi:pyrimidine operon attenuation protein/uracil phosphoribosyltransferase
VSWTDDDIQPMLDKLARDLETQLRDHDIKDYGLVGIHSGGAWIAQALRERLGHTAEAGMLDISFYRDDFSRHGLNPRVKPTRLPFDVDGRHLVLVDDVLMTGRTIRAAMNELFDYGRPGSIQLVVLFDVGRRELPIRPDLCAETLALAPPKRVELSGPSPLRADIMEPGDRQLS